MVTKTRWQRSLGGDAPAQAYSTAGRISSSVPNMRASPQCGLSHPDARLGDAQLLQGIDAYVEEPSDRSLPIFAHPRVVFTPHTGADTTESVERMGLMTIADIDAVLAGERSPRVLNPEIYGTSR